MSREWQQTKLTNYVMPNTVYYQCVWAVRDLERMENRLQELEYNNSQKSSDMVMESGNIYSGYRDMDDSAIEMAILRERIDGIRSALGEIPERYRETVLNNINQREVVSLEPKKRWRLWKQKFLFCVARNLSLM